MLTTNNYFTKDFRQSFSSGSFESFEESYESLATRDPENKKLILDHVSLDIFLIKTLMGDFV